MAENPGASVARGFLFADLRGYSAFVERRGDRAGAELLRAYRDLVRATIADFDGAEIRTEGDSFYLVFGSPSSAVLCGLAILDAASKARTGSGDEIAVGIGVHAGETVTTDEGYVGSVVNIAARVCAVAGPGELLVTDAVRSLTRTYLEVGFIPAGRRRLKGIPEKIALYRVVAAGEVVGQRRMRVPAPSPMPALSLGAGAIIVVVLVAALGLRAALIQDDLDSGSGPSASPTAPVEAASPSAPAGEFPNTAEQALLARIDDSVARHCERPDTDEVPVLRYGGTEATYSGPMAVDAGLRCPLGSTSEPDTVWFWQPAQSWAADEFFFSTAGSRRAPPGDCATDDRAHETWEFGQNGGRVLCLTGSRDAQVIWTYRGELLLGIAIRGDGDLPTLYQWWRDHARTLGAAGDV